MTAKEMYLDAMRMNDAGDREGFLALQAPEARWVAPGAVLEGRDAIRVWLETFWNAFSSFRHDIDRVIEDGDSVFVEGRWTGTNDGPVLAPDGSQVPPTDREVTFRWAMTAAMDRERGLCTEASIYFDQMELLGQLGLLGEPAVA